MAWISKEQLHKYICEKIKADNGILNFDELNKIVSTYPKRIVKDCGCLLGLCNHVAFGLNTSNYTKTQYYIDVDFKYYLS